METLGIYEPEELSLFGGDQLLMGLGSPVGPDSPLAFPDDRDGNKTMELLGLDLPLSKDVIYTRPRGIYFSDLSHEEHLMDASWLDTTLDLFNFVDKSSDVDTSSITLEQGFFVPEATAIHTSNDVDTTDSSTELSAEELFSQMYSSPDLSQQGVSEVAPVQASEGNEILAEVLSKLTSYLEGNGENSIPKLSLSPVSIDDVESLLSDPVSPAPNVTIDSGLESLLSSEPASPCNPDYHPSVEYLYSESEAGPMRSGSRKSKGQSRKCRTPIDRKERKKVQNKNAALKYRQKKRSEGDLIQEQYEVIEKRNIYLKDKVDSMTREIQYLKDLMAEVQKKKMNV